MKKIIFTFILFMQIGCLIAQNITVTGITNCVADVNSTSFHTIEHHLDVTNNSNMSMDILCQKTIIGSLPAGLPSWGGASYCFANACYGVNQTTPSNIATLAAGQTISYSNGDADAFSGYYDAEGITGQAIVQYCFYDANNISDSSCVTMTYKIEGIFNSVIDKNSSVFITNFYPNPTKENIYFEYYLDTFADLVIMDILGNQVKQIQILETGTQKVNISDLSKGIYFGSIISHNKIKNTQKIIVK